MKCFPVIYTRLKESDYPGGVFSVSPQFIETDSFDKLREIIDFVFKEDPLEVVISESTSTMFGTVCYFDQLFQDDPDFLPYVRDKYGRRIFGFWGFCAENQKGETIPQYTCQDCLQAFRKYLAPLWTTQKPVFPVDPESVELTETAYTDPTAEPELTVYGKRIYRVTPETVRQMLNNSLRQIETISYCSPVQRVSISKCEPLTHMSVSESVLESLRENAAEADKDSGTEPDHPNSTKKSASVLGLLFRRGERY